MGFDYRTVLPDEYFDCTVKVDGAPVTLHLTPPTVLATERLLNLDNAENKTREMREIAADLIGSNREEMDVGEKAVNAMTTRQLQTFIYAYTGWLGSVRHEKN